MLHLARRIARYKKVMFRGLKLHNLCNISYLIFFVMRDGNMFQKVLSVVLTVMMILGGFIPPDSSYAQDYDEYAIAVLDLEASGISETEASFLSEHLRSQVTRVVTTDKFKSTTRINYTVVERSQMDKIFGEFEIQNTGCTDVSCAIEFGKMLNAERIIIGTVGLVGRTYSITTRVVDIESSSTLSVADYTYTGPIDDLLTTGIQSVVNELLYGRKQKKSKKLYYIIGGIVLAGGVAAAILGGGSDGGSAEEGTAIIDIILDE